MSPRTTDNPRPNMAQTMLSDAELAAVDDYRFTHRIGSRSEAIRQLIAVGLGTSRKAAPKRGAKARTTAEPAEAPKPAAAAKPRKGSA